MVGRMKADEHFASRHGATDCALDVIADLHQMRDTGAALGSAGNISAKRGAVRASATPAAIAAGACASPETARQT